MKRTIYLYAGYYELIITDKKLGYGYTLISEHESVADAENAAYEHDSDAWLNWDKDVYNESQFNLDGDDYESHVYEYEPDLGLTL